ncbi:ankyrin repeat-containing protein At5g02620 [Fagus crenata]
MDPKLFKAAMTGNLHFLESLNEDDNSNILCQVTPKKNTVLHVAAEFHQSEFVQAVTHRCPLLFQQVNSKDDTPSHVAARVGCSEIVGVFISHAQTLQDTALHCATRNGHYQSVKLLIEADPELSNLTNNADESPLYLATSKGLTSIAKLILNASPSSSSHVGPNGITALHAAVYYSKSYYQIQKLMEILLEKKPNIIRERDNLGWTPLHYAAYFRSAELVRLFLKHDSFVAYVLDNDGESALHIAAYYGEINSIEEMRQSCPDICDLTNHKGQTALHLAILGGHENVVKYILKTPGLKCLTNEPDKDGNTPLHMSIICKDYRIMHMLARDERVDIGATNKENVTAYDIFYGSNERKWGFGAERVCYLLKGYMGIQGVQQWISTSNLKQPPVDARSSSSLNTKGMDNAEKPDFEKRNTLETNLLVAMLVATVTFAAAFTMPGGYKSDGPDQGLANLTAKVAFKAFVIFDTIAFLFSVMSVYLQLSLSGKYMHQIRYMKVAALCTYISIIGMALAFVSGMHVVLAKSIGLAITAYVMVGCLMLSYAVVVFVDPTNTCLPCIRKYQIYVLHLLLQYEVI